MLASICGTIDVNVAALPHPGELTDLDLLMRLKLIMQKQAMLRAAPEIVALDELQLTLTHRAEPVVTVVH
jgi:hypothetical protein